MDGSPLSGPAGERAGARSSRDDGERARGEPAAAAAIVVVPSLAVMKI